MSTLDFAAFLGLDEYGQACTQDAVSTIPPLRNEHKPDKLPCPLIGINSRLSHNTSSPNASMPALPAPSSDHKRVRNTPSTSDSDLYLCMNCYDAVRSFVRRDSAIHIEQDSCHICHGTHRTPTSLGGTTINTSAPSRRHSVDPEIVTIHRPITTQNRVSKQKRSRSPPSALKKDFKFHCSITGCSRAFGGFGFTRKDNRNVHERTVHGIGAARIPQRKNDDFLFPILSDGI